MPPAQQFQDEWLRTKDDIEQYFLVGLLSEIWGDIHAVWVSSNVCKDKLTHDIQAIWKDF